MAAGYIDAKIVVIIEQNEIIIIEFIFISEGIEFKIYISSGKRDTSNIFEINILIFSIYIEKSVPTITPNIVAEVPIKNPT